MNNPSTSTDQTPSPPPAGSPTLPARAVAIAGYSNCGKTTLICRLLSLAAQRDLRVAAVKHSHKILTVDQPGKDTWRFRQAGARAVALAAPGLLQVTHGVDAEPPIASILAALPPDADFILVEGFKHSPLPKIMFVPPGPPGAALPPFPNTIAYISEQALPADLPVFSREQIPEILDFILQWLQI